MECLDQVIKYYSSDKELRKYLEYCLEYIYKLKVGRVREYKLAQILCGDQIITLESDINKKLSKVYSAPTLLQADIDDLARTLDIYYNLIIEDGNTKFNLDMILSGEFSKIKWEYVT